MNLIVKVIIYAVSVIISTYLLDGVHVDSLTTALIVAAILVVLNTFIRPIIVFLTFPLTLLTLGIFLFVINATMILVVDYLVEGFEVVDFWWALLFSFIFSIIVWLFEKFEGIEEKRMRHKRDKR